MQELQSDDFFVPAYFLNMVPQLESERRVAQSDDFLKGIQGWAEIFPLDECVE